MASEAQLLAYGSCSKTTRAVLVFSTARRNRNHVASGIFRATLGDTSFRSTITIPNPPACKSRSVVFITCSRLENFLPEQRIHSSRARSTPAASADPGSKASLASTRTQLSCRVPVASASAESMMLVHPEESGAESISFFRVKPLRPTEFITGRGLNTSSGRAKNSVTAPRGSPPVRRSSSATPVSTRSFGVGAWNRNALGKRVASRASTVARTAAESIEHLGGRSRARQANAPALRRLRAIMRKRLLSPFVRYLNWILLLREQVVKPYRMILDYEAASLYFCTTYLR